MMDIVGRLKTFGFAVQDNALSVDNCERLADELDLIEQRKRDDGTIYDAGIQVVIYNLHQENPDQFLPLLGGEPVFPIARQVLSNGQQITLNSFSASRSVRVDEGDFDAARAAHIDTRMPAPDFEHTESIIAMLCLDDFTVESGASRIWPYSHLTGKRPPSDVKVDDLPGSVAVTAPRGSVIYWTGQTWHAIGRNTSGVRRWGMIFHYTYWWIKPTFDYTQCGPSIYEKLSPPQRALLGFSSRPPATANIRVRTVTDPLDLPADYAEAMRSDR